MTLHCGARSKNQKENHRATLVRCRQSGIGRCRRLFSSGIFPCGVKLELAQARCCPINTANMKLSTETRRRRNDSLHWLWKCLHLVLTKEIQRVCVSLIIRPHVYDKSYCFGLCQVVMTITSQTFTVKVTKLTE